MEKLESKTRIDKRWRLMEKKQSKAGFKMRAKSPFYRSKSPFFLFFLALLAVSLLFILFVLSPSPYSHRTAGTQPETSFVAALEHFLLAHHGAAHSSDEATYSDPESLDRRRYEYEMERLRRDPVYPVSLPIRVYVYEMPSKFTYDLLWLFHNTYKQTTNLTSNGSPVHRLIEQHSIDYWLWRDLIAPESERLLKNVVRVRRQEEADFFYVPFFTTISFFLLEKQQCKALYRVKL